MKKIETLIKIFNTKIFKYNNKFYFKSFIRVILFHKNLKVMVSYDI